MLTARCRQYTLFTLFTSAAVLLMTQQLLHFPDRSREIYACGVVWGYFPLTRILKRPTKLCVFCDASPQAYGIVIYRVQDGISQIIFSKTKVAPVKSKSLPTLKLLAVFIAFKVLHFVVRAYSHAVIQAVIYL